MNDLRIMHRLTHRLLTSAVLVTAITLLPASAYAKAQQAQTHYIAWPFITYAEPALTSEIQDCYPPQNVNILEKNDTGWALIDTHTGACWVYLSDNLRYFGKRMSMYANVGDSRAVAVISPQVVKVIEQTGDWLKIETWLGDMWIYSGVRDEFLDLVNKTNQLTKANVPTDLTLIGNGQYLRQCAADAFLAMQADMREAGLYIMARSGYRSYESQQYLFNRAVANYGLASAERWNARPGQSEHQTGLGVDILQSGFTGSPLSNARFQHTEQYAWLMQNAHKYGFILRYPPGCESVTGFAYEPWHWRYIGVEHATYMKENGISVFEAYLESK